MLLLKLTQLGSPILLCFQPLNKVKRDKNGGGGDNLQNYCFYGTNHYEVPNNKHSHCKWGWGWGRIFQNKTQELGLKAASEAGDQNSGNE